MAWHNASQEISDSINVANKNDVSGFGMASSKHNYYDTPRLGFIPDTTNTWQSEHVSWQVKPSFLQRIDYRKTYIPASVSYTVITSAMWLINQLNKQNECGREIGRVAVVYCGRSANYQWMQLWLHSSTFSQTLATLQNQHASHRPQGLLSLITQINHPACT